MHAPQPKAMLLFAYLAHLWYEWQCGTLGLRSSGRRADRRPSRCAGVDFVGHRVAVEGKDPTISQKEGHDNGQGYGKARKKTSEEEHQEAQEERRKEDEEA